MTIKITYFVFLGRPGWASGNYCHWIARFPIHLASRQLRRCIVEQRRLNRLSDSAVKGN